MSHDLTRTLERAVAGDAVAANTLLQQLYEELESLASRKLDREGPGHTLEPAALVHEAYLKLVGQTRVDWQGRTHFYAVAARAMQRVLVDHARRKKREKRGGGWQRVALGDAYVLGSDHGDLDASLLAATLERMRALDSRQAAVAEHRIFGGMSPEATAAALGVSRRTVDRDWKMARAWLRHELANHDG